jgi:predicted transcriptional regulator
MCKRFAILLALLLFLSMAVFMQVAYADQGDHIVTYDQPRPATAEEIAALNLTPEQLVALNVSAAQIYPNGVVMMPYDPDNLADEQWTVGMVTMPYDPDNLTGEQWAAMNSSITDARRVSFWELPLWIQVSYLSGSLIALAGCIALLPLAVRKLRSPFVNRNRDLVYQHIQSNPGCTAPDVSRGQHLNTGTVRYHIQRLELSGKIIIKKIGKFTRLYKNASTFSQMEMVIVSHLHNETSRQLLYAVMESPGTTNQRLAEQFGIDKSTVYVHMQRLVNDDIVVSKMDGKQKLYFVSEPAKPVLDKFATTKYQ